MLVFIYPGELCEQHVFGSLSKQHNSPAELLNQFGGGAPAALRTQHGAARGVGTCKEVPQLTPKRTWGRGAVLPRNTSVLRGPLPMGAG